MLNKAGLITAWQHDFEAQGNGIYTFFDNESAGIANTGVDATAEFGLSRAVTVKVDPRTHTATLIGSFNQPEGLTAPSQGNSQRTADGNTVVGWGSLPYFSEFAPDGTLLYNAQFPTGVNSYRAYLFPWNPGGAAATAPATTPPGPATTPPMVIRPATTGTLTTEPFGRGRLPASRPAATDAVRSAAPDLDPELDVEREAPLRG